MADVHGELRDDVSEGPVAGDERGGGGLGDDLRPRGGDDNAVPDLGDVPGQMEDAVGVDAAQVGQHERVGHAGGVALVGAGGQQDARRQVVKVVGGNGRHLSLSCARLARSGQPSVFRLSALVDNLRAPPAAQRGGERERRGQQREIGRRAGR